MMVKIQINGNCMIVMLNHARLKKRLDQQAMIDHGLCTVFDTPQVVMLNCQPYNMIKDNIFNSRDDHPRDVMINHVMIIHLTK